MIDREEINQRIDALIDMRNAADARMRVEQTEESWQAFVAADRELLAYCLQAQDAIDAERNARAK